VINARHKFGRLGLGTLGIIVLLATLTSFGFAAESIQTAPMAKVAATPAVGQRAPDFSLVALDGVTVQLSREVARGPVVLVVLRGWPGYQCPFCTLQFGQYLSKAADVTATGAHVLFVYPGPAESLRAHAEEFTKSAQLPAAYRVLLDPDFTFTLAYGLRWDAPNETAYPSTFVIDKRGVVTFARTSRVHGDRVPVADVLSALAQLGR
jgi:peroxiredoxin